MKKISISIILLLSAAVTAVADDAGAWLSVQANKGWEKAYAFARVEYRSYNKFRGSEAVFTSIGGGCKFAPWFKADLSYEFWDVFPTETFTHKAVLCGTWTLAKEGLSISLREKLEMALPHGSKTIGLTLRSRLRAQYNVPETIFRPYIMYEIFTWSSWIRSLHYAGFELAMDKHNCLDVFYMYHLPNGGESVHLLGLGYYFNF